MHTFKEIRNRMNVAFEAIIETRVESKVIREMMRYSIEGGKRLRPILFLAMMPECNPDDYFDLCLALELMHTCSLILDDLPCMDNDEMRRGRPSFHIRYGEIEAKMFVSYCMYLSVLIMREKNFRIVTMRAIADMVYKNMGYLGACTGQFLDLCPIMPHTNKKEFIEQYSTKEGLKELLNLKTTTFFQLGFQGAHIIAHADSYATLDDFIKNPHRQSIEDMTNDFGFAFQLFDDFDDIEQDYNRKKNGEFSPNFILTYGLDASKELFETHMTRFIDKYREMVCSDSSHTMHTVVMEIRDYLWNSVQKQYRELPDSLRTLL